MLWWLVAVIGFISIGLGVYMDGINYLLDNDGTRLSLVITALAAAVTVNIGRKVFQQKSDFDTDWFLADSCMSLGMIGTMLGFVMMLHEGLSNVDATNAAAMQQLIGTMAHGMSTALITTLAGLIASLFIKVQVVIQEHQHG